MNIKCRNGLFWLICICLPFLFIPRGFQMLFLGGPIGTELIVYPILLSFCFTLYGEYKGRTIFVDKKIILRFVLVYLGVLAVSLLWGLCTYPYYDLILQGPQNQIEKLPAVLTFLHEYGIVISERNLIFIWIIARFIKGIFFEIVYTFGFSYMIYCWFHEDPQTAVHIIQKSLYVLMPVIFIYSFFEIYYFWGYDWAANILMTINPYLHSIKENFQWWPPLLWADRVRSIFPEPSQFGMYAAFAMPLVWAGILNGNHTKVNVIITMMLAVLVYLSVSKTSTGLLLVELFLLLVYIVTKKDLKLFKKWIGILVVLGIAFGCSAQITANYSSNIEETSSSTYGENIHKYTQIYLHKNVTGIKNESSGSNEARFAIIDSDLRIGMDHWPLGVGLNLKPAYTADYLTEQEKNDKEVQMWGDLQKKYGILKEGYPSICEFSRCFAETGILGLLAYIFPMIALLYFGCKKIRREDAKRANLIVCFIVACIGSFGAGASGLLTTIQTYWLLLGVCFALVRVKENND